MGDVDPDLAARDPSPSGRKSILNRRFPGSGSSGRAAPAPTPESQSCPGGVCPNLELYDDDDGFPGGDEYDLHYNPLYPYDTCHYLGGFHDFKLNGTETCHLRVRGADGHADRLVGGLDGLFVLAGCFEGKPLYIRSRYSGPPGEDRVLYYNPNFGSWEFSVGREPSPDQLVLAGDEGQVSPIDVPRWHLAAVFNSQVAVTLPSDDEELFYVAAGVSVMCAEELGGGEDAGRLLQSPAAAAAAAAAAAERGRGGGAAAGGRAAPRDGGGEGGERLGALDGGRRIDEDELEDVRSGSYFGELVDWLDEGEEGEEPWERTRGVTPPPPQPPPLPSPSLRAGGRRPGPRREELEAEVRELREYWQRHEEEFYEAQYPYGEYPPEGLYDDGYGGPGEYDEGYGYGMY